MTPCWAKEDKRVRQVTPTELHNSIIEFYFIRIFSLWCRRTSMGWLHHPTWCNNRMESYHLIEQSILIEWVEAFLGPIHAIKVRPVINSRSKGKLTTSDLVGAELVCFNFFTFSFFNSPQKSHGMEQLLL